jgi:uncharacterized integral membrane protein (TIGR00698 family)
LVVVTFATLAAEFLANQYQAPVTVLGLLVGLSLSFLGDDVRLAPGLSLASTTLLRAGVILLGARVTIPQIAALGPETLACLVTVVVTTLASALVFARLGGCDTALGILVGGAVAICGASAAMAIALLLGEGRADRMRLMVVLIGISTMSATAMILYPALAHALGLSDREAGFFLGASIHDVAQALGAGYAFSGPAGEIATIVKLARVVLLGPLLLLLGILLPRKGTRPSLRSGVPWFVFGFLALSGVNSTGLIAAPVSSRVASTGSLLIVVALVASAMRSPVRQIIGQGWRPLAVICGTTVVSGAAAMVLARLAL